MKLSTTLSPWKLIARAGVFWDRNLVVNPEDVDSAGRENNDYPWARDTFFFFFLFRPQAPRPSVDGGKTLATSNESTASTGSI